MSQEDYNKKYLKYKAKYLNLQKEYNELILNKNMSGGGDDKIKLMLFKADWCGHCKQFKPTWENISKAYESKFNFIVYDADTQKEKFEEYKVDAFPTILAKKDNNIITYKGERSIHDLTNFLQQINN
jgi:thiol-disulfide isomerase/thioredoxin